MIGMLRTVLFSLAFYLGSLVIVLAALVAVPLGRGAVIAIGTAWSRYHRLCARIFLGIRVVVRGEVPRDQSFFAMKHESFFEAIDMPALFDRPVPFPKSELLRIPLWGRAATLYGVVPVARDQGAGALRAMVMAARDFAAQGRPLVIFPEGTRVPHGSRPPLKSGVSGLYKLLGLPVVPVAVDSGPLYHRRWKRGGTITVAFGEPIPPGLPREEFEARVLEGINALNGDSREEADRRKD